MYKITEVLFYCGHVLLGFQFCSLSYSQSLSHAALPVSCCVYIPIAWFLLSAPCIRFQIVKLAIYGMLPKNLHRRTLMRGAPFPPGGKSSKILY